MGRLRWFEKKLEHAEGGAEIDRSQTGTPRFSGNWDHGQPLHEDSDASDIRT